MERYSENELIKTKDNIRRIPTIYYPKFEQTTSDIWIITKKSDRLDLLATDYYGDPRYWVLIAKENKIGKGTLRIKPGTRLRLPNLKYNEDYINELRNSN